LGRLVTQSLTLLPPLLVLLLALLEVLTALLPQVDPVLIFSFATAPSSPLTRLALGVLTPSRFELMPSLILLATLRPQLTALGRECRLCLTQRLLLGFEIRCFDFNPIYLITGGEGFGLTAGHKFGHSGHIVQIRFGKNLPRMIWLANFRSIWGNDQTTRGTTDGR